MVMLFRPGAPLLHAADGCGSAPKGAQHERSKPTHDPATCVACAALAQHRDLILPPIERDAPLGEAVSRAIAVPEVLPVALSPRGAPRQRGPPTGG